MRKTHRSLPIKNQKTYGKLKVFILFLLVVGGISGFAGWEMKTSRLQAMFFSEIAKTFNFEVKPNESKDIRFPVQGPYDIRLGYVRIQEWIEQLKNKGFVVSDQARWSYELEHCANLGLSAVYAEKSQAGIRILDKNDQEIIDTAFPQRIYTSFESIPPIAVNLLLFIENRKLLDATTPFRNPAIEWERLGKAVVDAGINVFVPGHRVPGGSTLATQMEKFRHSPEGITDSAEEKLRQLVSASLRAYLQGQKTETVRKQIVLDYINSIPLSAAAGFGEVNGIGDGLWAWYGMDFDTVNRLLLDVEKKGLTPEQLHETGAALKSVLSLFLAQRRPTAYLAKNRTALMDLTNSHLRLLFKQGLISRDMHDAALNAQLGFSHDTMLSYTLPKAQRKAANLTRSRLMTNLKIDKFYDLDRIDLTAKTTLDMEFQKKITEALGKLKDPSWVETNGLKVPFLLKTGDPSKVLYSFSFFEKTPEGNALRIQTNNFDGPFNIDEQMKLDLGSSAKLRTLLHYLEIVAELHGRYAALSSSELTRLSGKPEFDHLSRWAIDHLLHSRERKLPDMLEASLDRTYSASPNEQFMTGGGLHKFANFDDEDDQKIPTVREAFRFSINLVFIRMMRDISYYHIFQRYGITPRSLEFIQAPEKKRLLTLFADKEGITFIKQFYKLFQHKTPQQIRDFLLTEMPPLPKRLAVAYRFLDPDAMIDTFSKVLSRYLPDSILTEEFVDGLYYRYDPQNFSLADIGYLSHIHPLELWVARYMQQNPEASLSEVVSKSADVRQEVYNWLFKTKSSKKQNKRIRIIIELEAFEDILKAWKKTGFPFDHLVPSYATSIGSSGDRPVALAELAGIIQNNGVRYPSFRFQSLHFAKDTPYETRLTLLPAKGEQVIHPEVAKIAKNAMIDVVQEGTARRLKEVLTLPDGTTITIGGKTGTGDHRYKTFGPGGILIGSKVMNRAAVFIFFIDDRFFGSITAYVPGKDAKNYSFSSGLPVQVLKMMIPDLIPMIKDPGNMPL